MADIETEDTELKDYSFTPSTYKIDNTTIIDYTGVEHDKIYLANRNNILSKPRPSWIPEFNLDNLRNNDFLPSCAHDSATGFYFVQDKIKTGDKKITHTGNFGVRISKEPIYEKKVYKMTLDLLTAAVDYYLKYEREILKQKGSNERITLPRAVKKMSLERYNGIRELIPLCECYKNRPELFKEVYKKRSDAYTEAYRIQSNVIFHEQYVPLLEEIKGKKLDLNLSKQDYIDSHSKGEETSYGDKNISDTLYDKYGISIKKQNGKSFSSQQLEKLDTAVGKVWSFYGNLNNLAKSYNLKISYADNCNQHARKAIGLFTSYYNAIGVSFFEPNPNEERQFNYDNPDITLVHETAHWLDCMKAKEKHFFFSSDIEGSTENQISRIFKNELKEKQKKLKNKSGSKKFKELGEYWYRTCECFARAMEQYYALTLGLDMGELQPYVDKAVFEEKIYPLTKELLEENRTFFNLNKTDKNIVSEITSNTKDILVTEQGISEKPYVIHGIDEGHKVYKAWGETELGSFLDNPEPSVSDIKAFDTWLNEHREDYIRLYHGTSAANVSDIEKNGIKVTTTTRRKSYQSESGYVYLSRFPDMAKTFGDMNNMSGKTVVYACDLKIKELKADMDQLNNKRSVGIYAGATLAASLLIGNGARIKRTINNYEISEINFESEKEISMNNENVTKTNNKSTETEINISSQKSFDVYIASNENLFLLIQDKLEKEGIKRWHSGYYDSENHIINGDLSEYLKSNPLYIIPDDKSFIVASKNYIDSKYKDFEINYLNENLELEIKNEHSGLSAKSYYNSKDTRKLCHIIKEADRNSDEYKNAIEQIADYFVSQGIFNEKTILVPTPQHTGKPEYTLDLAARISVRTKSPVAEILYCTPHDTLYEQKKNGIEPDVEFHLENAKGEKDLVDLFDETTMDWWKRNGDKVYLLDNNISTGLTFNKAEKLLPGIIPAPFAIGNFAEITFNNGRYSVKNLLKENEHTIEQTSKSEEFKNKNVIQNEPELNNTKSEINTSDIQSSVNNKDKKTLLQLGFNPLTDSKEVKQIVQVCSKLKTEIKDYYKDINSEDISLYKLDGNFKPEDEKAFEICNTPLYVINYKNSWNALQDKTTVKPGETYYHVEAFPDLTGLILHFGENTILSEYEALHKRLWVKCPNENIKITPQMILELDILSQSDMDWYRNNTFEGFFQNELKSAILEKDMAVEIEKTPAIPVEKILEIFENHNPHNEAYAIMEADIFISGWKNKDFKKLSAGLVYRSDVTPELRKLYNEVEGTSFPDGDGNCKEVYVNLLKLCDPETYPEYDRFKSWTDVINYSIKKGSSFEESHKRIYEFFKENLSKRDRIAFIRKEYGEAAGGGLSYNYKFSPNGILFNVLINGKPVSKSYSWEEYVQEISNRIIEGTYYKEPEIKPEQSDNINDNKSFILEGSSNGMLSKYISSDKVDDIEAFRTYVAENITGTKDDKSYFPQMWILGQKWCKENNIEPPVIEPDVQIEIDEYTEKLFLENYKNGVFDPLADELGDINYKHICKEITDEEHKTKLFELWDKFFPYGEPKSIKEWRNEWNKKLNDVTANVMKNIPRWNDEAKKSDSVKLILFLEKQEEWKESNDTILKNNEINFRQMLLNKIAKNNDFDKTSRGTHYDIQEPYRDFYFYLEPKSLFDYETRNKVIKEELENRGFDFNKEALVNNYTDLKTSLHDARNTHLEYVNSLDKLFEKLSGIKKGEKNKFERGEVKKDIIISLEQFRDSMNKRVVGYDDALPDFPKELSDKVGYGKTSIDADEVKLAELKDYYKTCCKYVSIIEKGVYSAVDRNHKYENEYLDYLSKPKRFETSESLERYWENYAYFTYEIPFEKLELLCNSNSRHLKEVKTNADNKDSLLLHFLYSPSNNKLIGLYVDYRKNSIGRSTGLDHTSSVNTSDINQNMQDHICNVLKETYSENIKALNTKLNKKENNMAKNKEQKYIAKLMSNDSTVPVDFWRWGKNNLKELKEGLIFNFADALSLYKNDLSSFDKLVIIKTEADGTELSTEVEITAGDLLLEISEKYKEKHEHLPSEDEFDAERWKEIMDAQKKRFEKTQEQSKSEDEKRTFTVIDSVLSAVDRAEFLAGLEHYVNGKKKGIDEYKINETLNKEDIKPYRFIYEGQGYLGPSIYESFVCKKNDDSGFKYIMVPHNPEYYKGFDKLVISESTYSNIEECQNALINTLVNLKENHNYYIYNEPNYFWKIPEKYKYPLLSYIEKNEKEICDKTLEFLKSHPDIEPYEKMQDNIYLYLLREPEAVDLNSTYWLNIFEKVELSISNPLLADTINVNKKKENTMPENKNNNTNLTLLTPEKYMELYNSSINTKKRISMDLIAAKAVIDSCRDDFGLKLNEKNEIVSDNGTYPAGQEIVPTEILRASIIGREKKSSINFDPRVAAVWDSLGITGNGKEYIFGKYLDKLNELYRTEHNLEHFGFESVDSSEKIKQVKTLTAWASENHPELFERGTAGAKRYEESFPDNSFIDILTINSYLSDKEQELGFNDKSKPFSFFIKDRAEFEQFADFEPVTNLSAEEAFSKLLEYEDKGYSAGIGIHIPDDYIFDDPDGEGCIIFEKFNDEYSFYIGDNFVKELKIDDNHPEHASNVIAAYKELDSVVTRYKTTEEGKNLPYKIPQFLYDKDKELFENKDAADLNIISTENIKLNNITKDDSGFYTADLFLSDSSYISAASITEERFAMPVATWRDNDPTINIHMVKRLISEPLNKDNEYLDVSSNGEPSIASQEKWNLTREQKTFDVIGKQIEQYNKELSEQKSVSNTSLQIKPVTLEDILDVMGMKAEPLENGKYKVFDNERGEYISDDGLTPGDENYVEGIFNNAEEIFERLDTYISDYYINDMVEQLEAAGVGPASSESLEDLCRIYKNELEKGNNKLELGELELAYGIIEPDSVIMPGYEKNINLKKETLSVTEEEIKELRKVYEKKIEELKKELEGYYKEDPSGKAYEQEISDAKININHWENISDKDISEYLLQRKKQQLEFEELTFNHYLELKEKKEKENTAQENGLLFAENEMSPVIEVRNKTTSVRDWIEPSYNNEVNVMYFGNLDSEIAAKEVIKKINDSGFNIVSNPQKLIIYNNEKFYSFNIHRSNSKYDKSKLTENDFIKFISDGFKVTRRMKNFEKIEKNPELTPLYNFSFKEAAQICQGLWEAEDKILLNEYKEQFPSKQDMPPVYLGEAWVSAVIAKHREEYKDYDFSSLLDKDFSLDFIDKPSNISLHHDYNNNKDDYEFLYNHLNRETIEKLFTPLSLKSSLDKLGNKNDITLTFIYDKTINAYNGFGIKFTDKEGFYASEYFPGIAFMSEEISRSFTEKITSCIKEFDFKLYICKHNILASEYTLWQPDKDLISELNNLDSSNRPRNSTWGSVDSCKKLAPGVYTVDTAGHGGIMVHESVAEKILSEQARSAAYFENGYYQFEEDVLANIPLIEMYKKHICEGYPWNEYKQGKYFVMGQKHLAQYEPAYLSSFIMSYMAKNEIEYSREIFEESYSKNNSNNIEQPVEQTIYEIDEDKRIAFVEDYFKDISNPSFNKFSSEEKLAIILDMSKNIDWCGEYKDSTGKRNVYTVPLNFVKKRIDHIGWEGEYNYFNLETGPYAQGEIRHYNEVIQEYFKQKGIDKSMNKEPNEQTFKFNIFQNGEKLLELKRLFSDNNLNVEWLFDFESLKDNRVAPGHTERDEYHQCSFNAPEIDKEKLESLLKENKVDYSLGLTSLGFDAKHLVGIDSEVLLNISDENFKSIQNEKEKTLIEQKLPYIKFGESESSFDEYIEPGTVWTLKEADQFLPLLNDKFYGMYKTDCQIFFPEEDTSYSLLTIDLGSSRDTRDIDGREPRKFETFSEYIRSTCSYPEVLETFEKNWIKVYAPTVSEEQLKAVNELLKPVKENLEKEYKTHFDILKELNEKDKKVHSGWLIYDEDSKASKSELKEEQKKIGILFDNTIKFAVSSISHYLYEQKDKNPEVKTFAVHELKNILQDVIYADARTATYGEHGYTFDFDTWHKSLENVIDSYNYDSFIAGVFEKKMENIELSLTKLFDKYQKDGKTYESDFVEYAELSDNQKLRKITQVFPDSVTIELTGLDGRVIFNEGDICNLETEEDGKAVIINLTKKLAFAMNVEDFNIALIDKNTINISEEPENSILKDAENLLNKYNFHDGDTVYYRGNKGIVSIVNKPERESDFGCIEFTSDKNREGEREIYTWKPSSKELQIVLGEKMTLLDKDTPVLDRWAIIESNLPEIELCSKAKNLLMDINSWKEGFADFGTKLKELNKFCGKDFKTKIEVEFYADELEIALYEIADLNMNNKPYSLEMNRLENIFAAVNEKELYKEPDIKEGNTFSLSLKQLYDYQAEKLGKFYFKEKDCTSLSSGGRIEFDDSRDSYYDMYSKDGDLLCCDGEEVAFRGTTSSGSLRFECLGGDEKVFELSKEEFEAATKTVSINQEISEAVTLENFDHKKFFDIYHKKYNMFYNGRTEELDNLEYESMLECDRLRNSNPVFLKTIRTLVKERNGDPFSSDREEAALIVSLKELGINLEKDVDLEFAFKNNCMHNFAKLFDKLYKNPDEKLYHFNNRFYPENWPFSEEEKEKAILSASLSNLVDWYCYNWNNDFIQEYDEKTLVNLDFLNSKLVNINSLLEVDDTSETHEVTGFLDDRRLSMDECSSEEEYYAQPTAADIVKEELDSLKQKIDLARETVTVNKQHELNADIEKLVKENSFNVKLENAGFTLTRKRRYHAIDAINPENGNVLGYFVTLDYSPFDKPDEKGHYSWTFIDREDFDSIYTEGLTVTPDNVEKINNYINNGVLWHEYDFNELADKIIQHSYEQSGDGFQYYIGFDSVARLAERDEQWVKENISKICDALSDYNDDFLLEFNEEDALSEENEIDLNFCSKGEDINELFYKDDNGRWYRKSETRLRQEEIYKTLGKEYEPDEPDELQIDGESEKITDIEEALSYDIENIFKELDSGEIEKNLNLLGVKIYGDPVKDGVIKLLVSYNCLDPENEWREDSIFNALSEENLEYDGMKVDINPITPKKSGFIWQYIQSLKGMTEKEIINENTQKLEELADKKPLSAIIDNVTNIPVSLALEKAGFGELSDGSFELDGIKVSGSFTKTNKAEIRIEKSPDVFRIFNPGYSSNKDMSIYDLFNSFFKSGFLRDENCPNIKSFLETYAKEETISAKKEKDMNTQKAENHIELNLSANRKALSVKFTNNLTTEQRKTITELGFAYSTLTESWKADFNQENGNNLLLAIKSFWPLDYSASVKKLDELSKTSEHTVTNNVERSIIPVDYSSINLSSENLAENIRTINKNYPYFNNDLTKIFKDILNHSVPAERQKILNQFTDCKTEQQFDEKLRKLVEPSKEITKEKNEDIER